MNKAVIILDGISDGKTRFQEIAKQRGVWTWSINASNVLSVASRSMGWTGTKDDKYYEFLNKLMALVNEYWNFKINYFETMIQKFKIHDKAQLLIIHGAGDIEKIFREEDDREIYFVNISRNAIDTISETNYDKTLIFDDAFEEQVMKLLNVLLEEKEINDAI